MITDEPFPLGVICNIYCSWCALSAPMAPSRLWLLCERCGFWTSRYKTDRRKVLCCTRALFVVWRAMHYGTVHFYSTHTHTDTHTNSAHFLDRKLRPYTTMKDAALPCLWSEVKRIVPLSVGVCLRSRVSNIRLQTYAGLAGLAESRFALYRSVR